MPLNLVYAETRDVGATMSVGGFALHADAAVLGFPLCQRCPNFEARQMIPSRFRTEVVCSRCLKQDSLTHTAVLLSSRSSSLPAWLRFFHPQQIISSLSSLFAFVMPRSSKPSSAPKSTDSIDTVAMTPYASRQNVGSNDGVPSTIPESQVGPSRQKKKWVTPRCRRLCRAHPA